MRVPTKAITTNGQKSLTTAKATPVEAISKAAPIKNVLVGALLVLSPKSSVSSAEPKRVALAIMPVATAS